MFLRKSLSNGKIYLSFVQGYRDESGKVKQKTVQKIGYLDDLKKDYDDPITHFKQIAKEKSNEEITEFTIKNLNTQILNMEEDKQKNLGYIVLKKIYHELGINTFLSSKQKKIKISILKNLIFLKRTCIVP